MIAVFTDLDGTLLDHDTYRFDAALPAIEALKKRSVPLILASSKTEAEMAPIADALGLDTPMIVENGAGIARLAGSERNASAYARIRNLLAALPGSFVGFGDWDVQAVARETGLPLENARLARQRRFSEPGHWLGTEGEKSAFLGILHDNGLTAVQGGRFFTIMPEGSKADAMARVAASLAESGGEPVFTIALGDAPNDLAMLQAADLGIIIANPHHTPLPVTEQERNGSILRSTQAGPAGWNEMILSYLAR
ncbi:HAD-IIB family hydrolase [Rhizobiaceae bacterium BDR2-2]|uniref:HAD-IIB family hydrolase n=1 Tax=Ectorhizobium quercum TaxID=2965071 RepID=A0AAE3SXA6_9HYPH|nr:HAD-IIB family hydrolase [Ectorhizobium quercum]MCX8998859.1 HAD-IIB family hydrolase [Ectorhizobium quercum]